jgi:hypothetical protein
VRTQVVLNNLYKYTALQMRFPVNAVALVDGTPKTLSLKQFLQRFLEFRCEVVRRRARQVPSRTFVWCSQHVPGCIMWAGKVHGAQTKHWGSPLSTRFAMLCKQ